MTRTNDYKVCVVTEEDFRSPKVWRGFSRRWSAAWDYDER